MNEELLVKLGARLETDGVAYYNPIIRGLVFGNQIGRPRTPYHLVPEEDDTFNASACFCLLKHITKEDLLWKVVENVDGDYCICVTITAMDETPLAVGRGESLAEATVLAACQLLGVS
jgi:hypothetical protein